MLLPTRAIAISINLVNAFPHSSAQVSLPCLLRSLHISASIATALTSMLLYFPGSLMPPASLIDSAAGYSALRLSIYHIYTNTFRRAFTDALIMLSSLARDRNWISFFKAPQFCPLAVKAVIFLSSFSIIIITYDSVDKRITFF